MEGKVVYKGRLTDLRTLTIDDKYVNKVNFFVIPQVTLLSGNRLGSIEFNIRVDFNSDFDVYGFVADEISQLLRLMYWKKRSGDYYSMKTSDDRPLFFVPTSIENFNNGAIFARIKHNLAIKACHFG